MNIFKWPIVFVLGIIMSGPFAIGGTLLGLVAGFALGFWVGH